MRMFRRGRMWWADLGRINGKRLWAPLRTANKREAQSLFAELAEKRVRMGLGLDLALGRARQPKSFKEAAKAFLEHSQREHKPSSYERAKGTVEDHLVPFFKDRLLPELEPGDVGRYKARRLNAAPPPAPATVNRELAILGRILSYMVEQRTIAESPLGTISKLPVTRAERPPHPTPEQLQAILRALPEPERTMVVILGYLGLRRGEVFALTRQRVDMERRLIHVDTEEALGWSPKTRRARTLEMPEPVFEALKAHFERERFRGRKRPGRPRSQRRPAAQLVFVNRRGKRFSTFKSVWARIRRVTGLDYTVHMLRHGVGSWIAEAGYSTEAIMEILGHRDPRSSHRYTHVAKEHRKKALEDVAQIASRENGIQRRYNQGEGPGS